MSMLKFARVIVTENADPIDAKYPEKKPMVIGSALGAILGTALALKGKNPSLSSTIFNAATGTALGSLGGWTTAHALRAGARYKRGGFDDYSKRVPYRSF